MPVWLETNGMASRLLPLLEADGIDRFRRSFLGRLLPRRRADRATVAAVKLGLTALFVLAFYVLPLYMMSRARSGLGGPFIRLDTVVNLSSVFFVYFGLFVGAYVVIAPVVGENEKMLAYPVTMRDLARFRLFIVGWKGMSPIVAAGESTAVSAFATRAWQEGSGFCP